MPSGPDAKTKRIQRFLATAEPKTALQRLFWEEAKFVIGDPTEIERRRARHTDYVGVLKDGKTRGFWLHTLSEVCVNIAGEWQRGLEEPLWVMTNLDPEKGLVPGSVSYPKHAMGQSDRSSAIRSA